MMLEEVVMLLRLYLNNYCLSYPVYDTHSHCTLYVLRALIFVLLGATQSFLKKRKEMIPPLMSGLMFSLWIVNSLNRRKLFVML